MKKLDMVLGGVEIFTAIGVSTLVTGALMLVKPNNLGIIKKIGVGIAGMAISSMAVNKVTDYVDDGLRPIATEIEFRTSFNKILEEELEKPEEVVQEVGAE